MFFWNRAVFSLPLIAVCAISLPARGQNAEISITGTVQAVNTETGGTHLTVRTQRHGLMDVRLGPTWYLAQNQFSFAKGDKVEITGSETAPDIMVARRITKGGKSLELRTATGMPMWAGRGRMMGGGGMMQGGCMGMGRMNRGNGVAAGNPVDRGRQIFASRCAGCHNAGSMAAKVGPGLKGLFGRQSLVNGEPVNTEDVRTFIERGGNGMPAFGDALTAAQLDDLIAYLKAL